MMDSPFRFFKHLNLGKMSLFLRVFERGFALDFPVLYSAKAPLVFAGFGITEPGNDDYIGLDPRGKIVTIFDPEPGGFSASRLGSGLRAKALNAQKHGALGLVAARIPQQQPHQPQAAQAPPPKAAKRKPKMQMLIPDDLHIPAFRMMEGDNPEHRHDCRS
jgi:hypothetical protein